MGFSNLGKIQFILFAVFLCLYLIILSGNITIATVICLDCSLHIPMYFFLGIISISETCYTFVILPKMLINLLSMFRTISSINCATQMFFFLGFAVTNCMLLGIMGYDCFVVICHPLQYSILMSWQVCGQLAATCAVIVFFCLFVFIDRLPLSFLNYLSVPARLTITSVASLQLSALSVLIPIMNSSSSLVEF